MKIAWITLLGFSAVPACHGGKTESDLNFASENLGSYDESIFDLSLLPKGIKVTGDLGLRSFDRADHMYSMRFFKVNYTHQVPLDQPLEGDIVNFEDIGGGMLTVDKFSDAVIKMTTAIGDRQAIPDGHYAAVICPISAGKTPRCLIDTSPLNDYKQKVQSGRCGKITATGSSLSESCKQALFSGDNTFEAIAYPLTASGNRFISGDKELIFLESTQFSLQSANASAQGCGKSAQQQSTGVSGKAFASASAICESGTQAAPTPQLAKQQVPTPPGKQQSPIAPGKQQSPAPMATQQMPKAPGMQQRPAQQAPRTPFPIQPNTTPPNSPFPNMMMPSMGSMAASGPDCFAGNTLIRAVRSSNFRGAESLLEDIRIRDLNKNDWVYNPLTHRLNRIEELTKSLISKGNWTYLVEGGAVVMTGFHPVVLGDGYDMVAATFKQTSDLRKTDSLLFARGSTLEWLEIEVTRQRLQSDLPVYNVRTSVADAVNLKGQPAVPKNQSLPFACESSSGPCQHFLAVKGSSDRYLVAGDFNIQMELSKIFTHHAHTLYQTYSNPSR